MESTSTGENAGSTEGTEGGGSNGNTGDSSPETQSSVIVTAVRTSTDVEDVTLVQTTSAFITTAATSPRIAATTTTAASQTTQLVTTTDPTGRVITLTSTPSGSTATVRRTTTDAAGRASTVTSLEVVGGATDVSVSGDDGDEGDASATNDAEPSLREGVAAPTGRFVGGMAAVVGGAVGLVALL